MQSFDKSDAKASDIVTKLPYFLILIGLLTATMFHFEIIHNSSLFQIVTVFMGFILCLIFQLRIISFYFRNQMKQLNLNQFGIVKNLIKSNIFGELNKHYVDKKNKKKYYQHTKTKNDPLFCQQNQQMFSCVMSKMRVNSEMDNYHRIRMIKGKWDALIFKIGQIQKFFSSLLKIYRDRSHLYKTFYNNHLNKLSRQQIKNWRNFFNQQSFIIVISKDDYQKNYSEYLEGYGLNGIDWRLMLYLLEQRIKLNDKKIRDISERILKQCTMYLDQIKTHRRQALTRLNILQSQYGQAKKKIKQNIQKIEQKKIKIEQAHKKMRQNRQKNEENMQVIFAVQYEIRLLNFDLEKLEIKKSYDSDMFLKKSQNLFKECVQQDQTIQSLEVFAFNKKILNYIGEIHQGQKFLHQKLIKHSNERSIDESLFQDFQDFSSPQTIISKYRQTQKLKNRFKQYLSQIKGFVSEMQSSLNKSSKLFDDYHKQINTYFLSENQAIYSFHEKMHDNLLVTSLKKVNEKQYQMIIQLIKNIQQQSELFKLHQEQTKQNLLQLNKLSESYKRLVDQRERDIKLKKQIISNQSFNAQVNQLFSKLIHFLKKYQAKKATTNIVRMVIKLFQHHSHIHRYIQSRKDQLQMKTQDYQKQDQPLHKIKQYTDQLFKRQMKQQQQHENYLHQQTQSMNKQQERQRQDKSSALLNRLLAVFFTEWCDSQFFHQILKQQLQISLNRKKPSFISYIHIKYIKLQQKQGEPLQNINPLGDNIFMCALQTFIDFRGKIAVHVETSLKKGSTNIPINILILIKKFQCPLRVCFTPFALGKSYGSMMNIPKLQIDLDVKIGNWNLTKLPFVTKFLKTFILIKFRKKFLWPKRFTLSIPLAVKNPISLAIRQSVMIEKQKQRKNKIV